MNFLALQFTVYHNLQLMYNDVKIRKLVLKFDFKMGFQNEQNKIEKLIE